MPNTFNLANQVYVRDAVADIDFLYGPYSSTEEACATIPKGRRSRGLTVGVLTDTDCVEYQWKAGIEDSDLVTKISKELPKLSYVPEYPEGQTIRAKIGDRVMVGFRFTSPNYGQCQISITKNGDPLKTFKTDKGYIETDLGVADAEGTFTYSVTGQDALSVPAEERLIFKVVVGGIKLTCDFADRLIDGVNTSTNLQTIFSASVADTSQTIKVKGELTDMDGVVYGNPLYVEGQDPSYAISSMQWIIGVISQWGKYKLTLCAYVGDSPDDTSGDFPPTEISYTFELLDNNDFVLTSTTTEISTNTNSAVSIPFIIESGGLHNTLRARGALYRAVEDTSDDYADGWTPSGDPLPGYVLDRSVTTNITNYWNMGKILEEGDYIAKMYATTIGGDPSPIPHDWVWIHIHVDRYQSDYNIETRGLIAQFTADGKSNHNDRDTDGTWKNETGDPNIYWELHGLNYNTNGWKHVDPNIPETEPGETMLSFTGESYGILKNGDADYNPMSLIRSYTGFTTEIIFRSRCIGELNTKVMTSHYGYNTNSAGYSASYDTVSVGSDGAQIRYDVSEDDWIHATLVIDKTTHTEGLEDIQDYAPAPLITVYINGSMCTSIIITDQTTFNNIQPLVLLNSAFNPAGNAIDFFGQCEIKAIRFYNRALLAHEVVKNYIASIYSDEEKRRIDGRNGDVLPMVKFVNINDECPATPKEIADGVQLITFEELNKITVKSLQKKRYVHAMIQYSDPDPEKAPEQWQYCVVQTQGTSSLAYPVKNYKITIYKDNTFNKKLKVKTFKDLGWSDESKFTLKCDYMEAAHLNNTPSCIFYNDMIDTMVSSDTSISGSIPNGWTGVPFEPGSVYDWSKDKRTPARRDNHFDAIRGFPCVINYYESRSDFDSGQNETYVGTYMFNIDKSGDSLGFKDPAHRDTNGVDILPIANVRANPLLYKEYDSTKTYDEGDKVAHEGFAYVANDDGITGAWDSSKWDAIPETVDNVMQSFEGVANKSNSAGCFYSFDAYKASAYHDDYCQTAYTKFLEEHVGSQMTLDEFIDYYAGSSEWYAHDNQGNPLYLLTSEDFYADPGNIPYKNEYEYYAADYEARFDWDDLEEGEAEFWGTDDWGLKRMINWVSDASADLDRFRNEFDQYFDLEYCIIYYLQMIMFGQVDNAGKNSMWDTWDGLVWRPRPYDLDTAVGLDNSGFEAINPDAELIRDLSPFKDIVNVGVGGYSEDVSATANSRYAAYNTRTSKFWIAFATAFQSQIANMYGKLRSAGVYALPNICEKYLGNTSDIIGESYYNRDMTTKFYKLSDIETYITRMHGNRIQKFKSWITKRIVFCDTLFDYYNSTDSLNGNVVLRSDAYTSGAPVSVYLSIQTYSPQYVKVDVGSTRDAVLEGYCSPTSEYEDPNRPGSTAPGILFRLPLISGNKEIQVSGAGNIRLIGNLAGLKASSLDLGPAVKLTNLDLSGSTKLVALSLSNNKYLQYLNCEDAVQLGTDASGAQLDLSNCVNLKEVNVNRTKLTSIVFPVGGSLKKVYAKNTTITGITLDSCQFLDTIDVEGCENILSYTVHNCPSITGLTVDGLPITSFNVNDCSNITSISLAGCNAITTFNIANCPKISSLNFQNSQSPAITTLNLAAIDGLTSLNISGSNSVNSVILPASIGEGFKTFTLTGSSIKNVCYDTLSEDGINMARLTGLTSLSFRDCTKAEHIFGLNYKGSCSNLFQNCTSLLDVAGTIETTGSAASIFYGCSKLSNLSNTTFLFDKCTSLASAFRSAYAIPLTYIKKVFDSCGTSLTDISNVCYGKGSSSYTSSAYTTLPSRFFGNLKNVTTASYAFYTSGIASLPATAFTDSDGNIGLVRLTNGGGMFANNSYSRMSSMPTNILKYFPRLSNASRMFGGCGYLAITLPSDFFTYCSGNPEYYEEYDPENTYNLGDKVAHNNTVYIANTNDITGAWNSSHWSTYNGLTNIRAMFYGTKVGVNMNNMANLLAPLTKLTDAGYLFQNVTTVTGVIPEGFLAKNTSLTNVACCFEGTKITGLPSSGASILRLSGDTTSTHSLADAAGMFYNCTSLTGTVPSSLFAGGTKITTIGNTSESFPGGSTASSRGIFQGCTGISRFGDGFFNEMPNLTNISNVFYGCTSLIGCPGANTFPETILNSHVKLSNVSSLFRGCTSLVVPTMPNIFASSKSTLRTADYIFYGCTNVSSINNDLFSDAHGLTNTSYAFYNCTNLNSDVGEWDLFNRCNSLTNTSYMFYGCSGLYGVLPASLFNSCRNNIENVAFMFNGCGSTRDNSGITGIGVGNEDYVSENPQLGLLAECLKLTNTSSMFRDCYFLTGKIPWDIFWTSNIEKEYAALINTSYMFYNCGFNQPTYYEADGNNYMIHPDFFAKTSRIQNISFMFGKDNEVYTSSVYPKWSSAYPVHPQAFLNMYSVTTFRGLFKKCIGLAGTVSNQWFANCRATITDGQEAFAQTKIVGVADDFLRASTSDKNAKLTDVGKMFYGCSTIVSNLPPMNNINAFSKIDYSNVDAGYGGFCYGCTNATNYSSFNDVWKRQYSY